LLSFPAFPRISLARLHIISRAAGFGTLIRHHAQDSPKFSSYSILHDGFTSIAVSRVREKRAGAGALTRSLARH